MAARQGVAAVNAADWRALERLLAPEFELVDGRRTHGRGRAVRAMRAMRKAFPDLRTELEEARDGGDGVAWLRFRDVAREPRPLELEWWERWTLTPARDRIRRLDSTRVERFS